MAGNGYGYRGYSAYNGSAPKTDGWSQTSYASDHVHRPVVVDSDGRKHPIVSFSPGNTETRVVETETIVKQQVISPFVNDYKHNSYTQVEPLKDYGRVEDQWRRPSSPVNSHHAKVEPLKDYGRVEDQWRRPSSPVNSHMKVEPRKDYGRVEDQWRRPSSSPVTKVDQPLKDYGRAEDQWRRSSSPVHGHHGRPQKVDEFLTKVQTEASNKLKSFGLVSPSLWHRPPNSAGYPPGQGYEPGNNTGYGDYKPDGRAIQKGDYDNNVRNNNYYNSRMEPPAMNNSDGWARPSRSGWGVPPDTTLSRPTNDIGTAVEYLKEAARPTSVPSSSPHTRMTVPITTTGPKRDQDYGQTIDSREAARRYGNFRPASVPEERYTGTIDSREAARRYGGTVV